MVKETPSSSTPEEPDQPESSERATRHPGLDAQARERLTRFLQEHYADPMLPVYAEMRFYWAGLTSVLEQTGILEAEENPNPIDLRTNPTAHEQWWVDHPEVSAAFDVALRAREERIRLLYIGALLGPYLRRAPVDPQRE
jgi:hypothetical protein